jgi:3-phenylpropionate/trans-cinnamate dioxygenase ferredoxin subunit
MRIRAGRADLPPGAMRGHPAGPERFVLVANVEGTYFALDDWCNHAGCLLSNGELEGGEVVCPCHGMTFDVRTGAATSRPRLCEDQRAYRIEVRDGDLWVEVD